MRKIVKSVVAIVLTIAMATLVLPNVTYAKSKISLDAAAKMCELYNADAEIDFKNAVLVLESEDDKYYNFHYYEDMSTHIATINRYSVEKATGDLYLYDVVMDDLVFLLRYDYNADTKNGYWIEFTGYEDCAGYSLTVCEAITSEDAPRSVTLNGTVRKALALRNCMYGTKTEFKNKKFKIAKNCQYIEWEDCEKVTKYSKKVKQIIKYSEDKKKINLASIDTRMLIKNGKITKIIVSA